MSQNDRWNRYVLSAWQKLVSEQDDWISDRRTHT